MRPFIWRGHRQNCAHLVTFCLCATPSPTSQHQAKRDKGRTNAVVMSTLNWARCLRLVVWFSDAAKVFSNKARAPQHNASTCFSQHCRCRPFVDSVQKEPSGWCYEVYSGVVQSCFYGALTHEYYVFSLGLLCSHRARFKRHTNTLRWPSRYLAEIDFNTTHTSKCNQCPVVLCAT